MLSTDNKKCGWVDRLRDAGHDIYLNPRGAAAREFAIRERTVVNPPQADDPAALWPPGDDRGAAARFVH